MTHIPFSDHTRVMVVAFEGWNDAGDAASHTAQMIIDQAGLIPGFSIDPEEYFDFQLRLVVDFCSTSLFQFQFQSTRVASGLSLM